MNTPSDPMHELPAIGILAELAAEHRAFLASFGRFLRASNGDIIIAEGDPQESLYLILSGIFHVVLDSGERPVLLAKLGEGDSVGEINLFDPAVASATVVSRGNGLVWSISRSELDALSAAYPEAGVMVLRGLLCQCSKRIRKMNQALALASASKADAPAGRYWGLAGIAATATVLASKQISDEAQLPRRPTPEAGHEIPRKPAEAGNDRLEAGPTSEESGSPPASATRDPEGESARQSTPKRRSSSLCGLQGFAWQTWSGLPSL